MRSSLVFCLIYESQRAVLGDRTKLVISVDKCCYSGVEYSGRKVSIYRETQSCPGEVLRADISFIAYVSPSSGGCGELVGKGCIGIASFLEKQGIRFFSSVLGTNVTVIGGSLARNFPSTRKYSHPHGSQTRALICSLLALVLAAIISRGRIVACCL